MASLATEFEALIKRDSPIVIHGSVPPSFDETAEDVVNLVLKSRPKAVNYFPVFSQFEPEFALSTPPALNGDIARAAFDILGAAARTVHPTHSWMVTGRSAAIMIPGNLYAMTPSGMGSPVPEITNFSSLEFLVGADILQSIVIEAAEENARVHYALADAPVSAIVITADGAKKESTFKLRRGEPIARNREKIRELWLSEDALAESEWGLVVQTRVAHDRLMRRLQEDPEWLVS